MPSVAIHLCYSQSFYNGKYFNELRWKNIRANNLLQFNHQVTIEIRFRNSLTQERFKPNLEFRNQIIVSSIKFWKCFANEASTRAPTNSDMSQLLVTSSRTASHQEALFFGIPCQPLWRMLPVWYRTCQMQVNPSDFLCCAGRDFVCPGACKVAILDKTEGLNMHWAQLF